MRSNISLGNAVSNIVKVGQIATHGAAAGAGVMGGIAARYGAMAGIPGAQNAANASLNFGVDQRNQAVNAFKGLTF